MHVPYQSEVLGRVDGAVLERPGVGQRQLDGVGLEVQAVALGQRLGGLQLWVSIHAHREAHAHVSILESPEKSSDAASVGPLS